MKGRTRVDKLTGIQNLSIFFAVAASASQRDGSYLSASGPKHEVLRWMSQGFTLKIVYL